MSWTFTTADHVKFGTGVSADLEAQVRRLGTRALVVTGATPDRFAKLLRDLPDATCLPCPGEPTLDWLTQALAQVRATPPDVVVGLGGGSAIDGAKALAALLPNPGEPLRYLEVVGLGEALSVDPLPMIAVPTTSGTGAEVTKNAVISVPSERRKVSLRDDRMLPNLALIDPKLTAGSPIAVTAATGLDALTQVIEPYLSSKANPMTDALCREGIARAGHALPKLLKGAENAALREDMALASVFGGMALANSGLGAVHGLAGVLGGWCGAPHGALCGRLLPSVLAVNAKAIAEHKDTGLETRFRDVARWLTGRPDLEPMVDHLKGLLDLGLVPRLREMELDRDDLEAVATASKASSSMKGNPVVLNEGELVQILENAY